MAAFRLSKWYLDCVDGAGEASIVYVGAVRWGAFHLDYSSILETHGERISCRRSLRAVTVPALRNNSVVWRSKALEIEGEWRGGASRLTETVFESPAGRIDWHCLMPRADARMGDRSGFGYVERLEMTIAPWKLPLRTLRWGRFGSASDWIVWIDWRGEFTRALSYVNGRAAQASSFQDDRVEFEDGSRLVMGPPLILRQGPLGSTALSAIPGLRSAPVRLLQVNECKWRSPARLEQPGRPAVEGWVIHERVEWPQ